MTHSLIIAGLGRVGSTDDARKPRPARSHVGASRATGRFALACLVEPDAQSRDRARAQWPELGDVPIRASLADAPRQPDLLVLATPTATRERDVDAALALRPRLLMIEKPLAADLATARRIARRIADAGQATRICYMRRFAPAIGAALDGFSIAPIKAVASYTRGIATNCSHLIDLLVGRYGPPRAACAAVAAPCAVAGDADIDFRLRFDAGFDLYAFALPGAGFAHVDLCVYFPEGRVEIAASGTRIRVDRLVPDYVFPGYAHLGPVESGWRIDPNLGMTDMYVAAAAHLDGTAIMGGCTPDEALATLGAIDAVNASARADFRPVEIDGGTVR